MFSEKTREFSFVIIGRFFSSGMFAIFSIIFAILLEPENFGRLSYSIAIAGFVSIISRFGLGYSVVVYQAKKNIELAGRINLFALILITISGLILAIFDIFAAVLSISLSLSIMYFQNLLGMKRYKQYFWTSIVRGILIISIPLILYNYLDLVGIIIGLSIAYVIIGFQYFSLFRSKLHLTNLIKNNIQTFSHNFGVDVSTNLVKYVDKIMIMPILGFSTTGFYQFNIQILFGMEIIPLALHGFLLSEESSGKNHKKIQLGVIFTSILIVICTIIFSPIIIETFFPKYTDGISSLQIIILSLIPLTFSYILNAKLQSQESNKIGYSAFIRIGSLLMLIFIFGETYGLIGLSYAYLLSSIVYVIFLAFLFQKKY
jgi:O-antigen/teichoic acid export membrane protein